MQPPLETRVDSATAAVPRGMNRSGIWAQFWERYLAGQAIPGLAVGVGLRALPRPSSRHNRRRPAHRTDRRPLMLAGGEHVVGPVLPRPHENLGAHYGWSDVQVEIVADSRRYLVEERCGNDRAHRALSCCHGRVLPLRTMDHDAVWEFGSCPSAACAHAAPCSRSDCATVVSPS